jgi:hypothetical protein
MICVAIMVFLMKALAAVDQAGGSTLECSRRDGRNPSIYLSRDTNWSDKKLVRMVLHNNSNCTINLFSSGKQLVINSSGSISQASSDVAENGAIVTLLYKVNSLKEPWAFMTYWPYGDTNFSLKLSSGHSIKFVVPSSHVKGRRKIAVPFYYEWEPVGGESGMEHLVYAQYQ